MTHPYHQNDQPGVLNLTDDAIVPHTVFPQLAEFRTMERLADAARIRRLRHPLREKASYALSDRAVEILQIPRSLRKPLNPPTHRSCPIVSSQSRGKWLFRRS